MLSLAQLIFYQIVERSPFSDAEIAVYVQSTEVPFCRNCSVFVVLALFMR